MSDKRKSGRTGILACRFFIIKKYAGPDCGTGRQEYPANQII